MKPIKDYAIGIDKIEITLKAKLPDFSGYTRDQLRDQLFEDSTPNYPNLFNITQAGFNPNYVNGRFHLKHMAGKKTKNYNLVYSVCYDSIAVATLLLDNILNPDLINLKIENYLIYDKDRTEAVVIDFLEAFQLQINNFSAIDIFIDCRTDLIKLFDRYFFNLDEYHFVGRAKTGDKVFEFNRLNRNGSRNPTYYIGSKDKKQVVIYNKSKELGTSKKAYINAFHETSLSGTADVFRFELRLKNKYLTSKNYKIIFDQIYDSNFQKTFMAKCLEKFVDFRAMDNEKVTRCTKIKLFDLSPTEKVKDFQTANKVTYNSNLSSSRKSKSSIKHLIETAIRTYNKKYLTMAYDLAVEYDLMDFYIIHTKGINIKKNKPVKSPDFITDLDFNF